MESSINNANYFYFFFRQGEFHKMHSKSDDAEIMVGFEIDDIINKLFESSLKNSKKD